MSRGARAGGNSASRILAPVLLLAAALSCGSSAAADGPGTPRLVVGIYPNESDGAPGTVLANRAIRSTFAAESADRIDFRNEYVDTSRLADPAFRQAQVSFLQRKYAGRRVDLVFAGLSSGLDFVLEFRDQLFPGAPVVYVAVDRREVGARRLPPDVVGVPIRMDLAATLDVALRLHPDTRQVFVVTGSSAFDASWADEARRTFRPYEGRLEFVYLAGLPMDDLLRRVAALPEQSIVYYLHVFQDGTGRTFIPADVLERLAEASSSPVYSHVDTYVGRGVVGGKVFSFEAEGRNAARLGLRVLAGEKPGAILVPEVSENLYLFDSRQLHRWGVGEESLPAGSVVLHREPTVWDVYKWHIVGAVTLLVVQAALIAGLLAQRVMRRRADERFRRVVEAAPSGMLLVGRDGAVVMANAAVEMLFGYRKDEVLGRPVGLLVPEALRDPHTAGPARLLAASGGRPLSPGSDLSGRRKDGSTFPVEIGLSPLRTSRGLFVLATVVDLTERRRAEEGLRTSQRELKLLTGRLLEAQEVERRRIARELHDDLNQSLALLAVEIDVLARTPPASAAELADRLAGMSARVRELSSAVHHLSHRLHPSKLEQLGFVAAVDGLCKDMHHGHDLEVKFTHYPDPGEIPADTALCLYRIVQEALRNVVKHSGGRHALVDLCRVADGICLRVADDGAGFDPGSVAGRSGLGLVSMRERLHLVDGVMAIESCPGGGTRIDVRVPLLASVRPEPLSAA